MRFIVLILMLSAFARVGARGVTVCATDEPASTVFRTIVEQTGMNFVYSSDLLTGVKVSVNVVNKPIKSVLSEMFRDTGISFSIKGKNVVLKRAKVKQKKVAKAVPVKTISESANVTVPNLLEEVVVVSRLEAPAVETSEIGAKKLSATDVHNTPSLLGESDVVKTLQSQPGVSAGTDGLAGMYVHGGNADENMFLLDNVPLYQVNHFAGLFSAFNADIINYIDFFKTSVPAKYDGRLSSFMDVRLSNVIPERFHGSARLGLTSGAFNVFGPIGSKTGYLVGLRRSWFDAVSVSMIALINSMSDSEKIRLRYAFTDLNAKVIHRFSSRLNGFVSVYFGDDVLKSGSKEVNDGASNWLWNERYDFDWGNIMAQTGLNYRLSPDLSVEFTAAFTRYFSKMKHDNYEIETDIEAKNETHSITKTDNSIDDWIFRGDFDWNPVDNFRVRFGGNYVRHSFMPGTSSVYTCVNGMSVSVSDSISAYGANEFNAYIEDDWTISNLFRTNIGLHGTLFNIDHSTRVDLSPRASFNFRPSSAWAIKAAYSRTNQYVHQLSQSYLALPTDRWIPVMRPFKPQTADKVALGGYFQWAGGMFSASVEGYYKWMHNLIDYCDEYYLQPPLGSWNSYLTSGKGTAKGIDFKIEKTTGRVTGQISYSLAWADRCFAGRNGGKPYPARFDNRHTINISLNWIVSPKVTLNALWVGHSGNRFTLMPQVFESPWFMESYMPAGEGVPLKSSINNYQLPFYHRLDLSCSVKNRRGYWTFGLYNAYCHMNTIGIRRGYRDVNVPSDYGYIVHSKPVFQKIKMLPLIPSVSYTWKF